MSVTETSYCDFVVWSETGDFHCERILPDTDFISEQLNLSRKIFLPCHSSRITWQMVYKRSYCFANSNVT